MNRLAGRRIAPTVPVVMPVSRIILTCLVCCLAPSCGDQVVEVVAVRVHMVERPSPQVHMVSAARLPARPQVIRSAVGGRLLAPPPPVGSRLVPGAVVARIDPKPYEEALARQRARFQQVEADVERLRGLRGEGLRPPIERAELDRRLQTARAALQAAEQDLLATRVVSPAGGVVSAVGVGEERLVEANQVLVELVDDRRCDLRLSLAADLAVIATLDAAALPQRLAVETHLPGGWVPVDVAGREFADGRHHLRLRLQRPEPLPPVDTFDCRVVLRPADELLLPAAAVQAPAGGPMVWVLMPGEPLRVARRPVRVARIEGDLVYINEGVRPGERVVVAPPPSLHDGSIVRAVDGP